MKIWTSERSNNVHTQRNPLEQCAILHHAPRTTLASLFFGRYACLLGFLRPLIFRRGLLATSWRRTFGLPLSRCGATGSGCSTLGPIGASRRDLHNALLLCTALESNPKKRGKPWGEKNLVQPRENRPGEAHEQPQLATQDYPRARSK